MPPTIERVQTGLRMEKRILKVLKAIAEYLDLSLGDLLEGIVLHAFEGQAPFKPETLAQIARLKEVYGLTLTAADSHALVELEPKKTAAAENRARAQKSGRAAPTGRTSAKGR